MATIAPALHESNKLSMFFNEQHAAAARLYSRLEDWEIRVLELSPGTEEEDLEGTLSVATLIHDNGVVLRDSNSRTEYIALSYAWGEPVFDHCVQVNGMRYPITAALHEALRHIRSEDRAIFLWVDAICINQHDTDERSNQVMKMIIIFHKAESVVIWLGNLTSFEQEVLHGCDAVWGANHLPLEAHPASDLLRTPEALIKAARILEKPWFSRRWVVQEAWAAQQLFIQTAETRVEWDAIYQLPGLMRLPASANDSDLLDDLQRSCRQVLGRFERCSLKDYACLRLRKDSNLLLEYTEATKFDLVNVLWRTAWCQSADARDIIFAVVGMSNTRTSYVHSGKVWDKSGLIKGMPIDYSQTLRAVFETVTIWILRRDITVSILLINALRGEGPKPNAQVPGSFDDEGALPSWVIDWRAPSDRGPWIDVIAPDGVHGPSINFYTPGVMRLRGCICGWVHAVFSSTEVKIPASLEEQKIILVKPELRSSDTETGTAEIIIDNETQRVTMLESWVASPQVRG